MRKKLKRNSELIRRHWSSSQRFDFFVRTLLSRGSQGAFSLFCFYLPTDHTMLDRPIRIKEKNSRAFWVPVGKIALQSLSLRFSQSSDRDSVPPCFHISFDFLIDFKKTNFFSSRDKFSSAFDLNSLTFVLLYYLNSGFKRGNFFNMPAALPTKVSFKTTFYFPIPLQILNYFFPPQVCII